MENQSKSHMQWYPQPTRAGIGHRPLQVGPNHYQSMLSAFESSALTEPHAPAIQTDTETVDYQTLNFWAEQIADQLRSRGVTENQIVPLAFEHGALKIAASLGVAKAGAAWVPLDMALDDKLLIELVDHCTAILTLVQNIFTKRAFATQLAGRSLALDSTVPQLREAAPTINPNPNQPPPETLADICFTSGSTAKPKAVMRTHAQHSFNAACVHASLKFGPKDNVAYLQNFWSANLAATLGAGACVHPCDISRIGLQNLAHWLTARQITAFAGIVTGFRQFLRALKPEDRFPDMRVVTLTGEPLGLPDIERFHRHFPEDCTLLNCYGATEQVRVTQFAVDRPTLLAHGPAAGALPVGYSLEGITLHIVNDNLQAVPTGSTGEILVESLHPSSGYFKDQERSAETWIEFNSTRCYRTGDMGYQNTSGLLFITGRKDDQVKIRGHKVLPAEIEEAANALPQIAQCAVVPEYVDDNARLIAYYEQNPSRIDLTSEPATSAELRAALTGVLPHYMIPHKFVALTDQLPTTPSGKLDRRAIARTSREPVVSATSTKETRAPDLGDELAGTLRSLVAETLKLSTIGDEDSFFDLGGDSLQGLVLIQQISDAMGYNIDLGDLFEAPTVESLARLIKQGKHGKKSRVFSIKPGTGPELFALRAAQQYTPLTRKLTTTQPVLGVYVLSERHLMPSQPTADAANYSLDVLVNEYLHALEDFRSGTTTGYQLMGFSYAGIVAVEVARKIELQGGTVDRVFLLDSVWRGARLPLNRLQQTLSRSKNLIRHISQRRLRYNFPTGQPAAAALHNSMRRHEKLFRDLALHDYSGPESPLNAEIVLIKARDHIRAPTKPAYGWGAFSTKPVRVHNVPGNHWDMLNSATINDVARVMDSYMDATAAPPSPISDRVMQSKPEAP